MTKPVIFARKHQSAITFVIVCNAALVLVALVFDGAHREWVRFVNSAVAGVIIGLLFMVISQPTQRSMYELRELFRRIHVPLDAPPPELLGQRAPLVGFEYEAFEVALYHVLLGGIIFFVAGLLGRDSIFGIALFSEDDGYSGVVTAVFGLLMGAILGLVLSILSVWFDAAIVQRHAIVYVFAALPTCSMGWCFFSLSFPEPRVVVPFGLCLYISRITGSIVVNRKPPSPQTRQFKSLIAWSVLILPLTACLSSSAR